MIQFSSKFKACIYGIRYPGALSSAQLLHLWTPLNINSFKELQHHIPDRTEVKKCAEDIRTPLTCVNN